MNTKNKKELISKQTIKALFSYIGCLCISVFVMLFLNGTVGVLLTTALICAFVLSAAVTFAVRPSVNISSKLNKTAAAKNEKIQCIISFSKNIILPAPIIEVHLKCSGNLSTETDICHVSLAGTQPNTIAVDFTANYSGSAGIRLEKVLLCGFLGIFKIPVKSLENTEKLTAAIYPDIPEVPMQTDFIKRAVLSAQDDDDEDEELSETAMLQKGIPGYDHREYVPGDPIKRINWKLSSKRDVYLLRLDELTAASGNIFFLDCPKIESTNDSAELYRIRDRIIEGLLAVFSMSIREGREVIFFWPANGKWERFDIYTTADLSALQEKLSEFEPCELSSYVPDELLSSEKTAVCFTIAGEYIENSVDHIADDILSRYTNIVMVGAQAAHLPALCADAWYITDEFEIKKY
ncbi:MAG: DUF58 domain-containing protein [Acutalibacteraceae bacterium]|nr:DUF58 domain-containing protein [Clostridia bacterium]MEE3450769.1 DUF58 domain-containing protein [Acutalibacteraceae bacterium]